MQDNFNAWCNKRKQEVYDNANITSAEKEEEVGKLYDRMTKYTEKMAFVHDFEHVEEKNHFTGISVKTTIKKPKHHTKRTSVEGSGKDVRSMDALHLRKVSVEKAKLVMQV